jgi:ABC-type transport system involved in cytochrome bd biosynthesis fused ATPase/permease subunit
MHFQYPTSLTKTFEDINLEIAAGETVALVGEFQPDNMSF